MTTVAVLFPVRPDGGRRDELRAFCLEWWATHHPEFELTQGRHDAGLFNRSAAVNAAAALTSAEVLIVADADVIVPPEQVDAAVKLAAETGRAVLAYGWGGYTPFTERMTDEVLAGRLDGWMRPDSANKSERSPEHISSCVVVPRALFDAVGGMDDRFEGWGPEDRAFFHALRVAGGGVLRVDGPVFHLHHPFSRERDRKAPHCVANRALCGRYESADSPDEISEVFADRAVENGVLVAFLGNGRADELERAVESFTQNLSGPVARTVIVDDSGNADHQAWIRWRFPHIELVRTGGNLGYAGAMSVVWAQCARFGLPWLFLVEEDFEAQRPVDLEAMQRVMVDNPHLFQIALRRQAWFPSEIEAGGIIEQDPDAYTDRDGWVEHRKFATTNPTLWRRSFVVSHPWPAGRSSERRFGDWVFEADPEARSAFWGDRTDDPWVIHDGVRSGKGY